LTGKKKASTTARLLACFLPVLTPSYESLAEAVSILLKHAIIHFAVLLRKFNSLCAGRVPLFSAQNRRQPCRFDM
jgi:hypothetical protein